MRAKLPSVCHCGSGKLPGIMRLPERSGAAVRWCCGDCYGRRWCPGAATLPTILEVCRERRWPLPVSHSDGVAFFTACRRLSILTNMDDCEGARIARGECRDPWPPDRCPPAPAWRAVLASIPEPDLCCAEHCVACGRSICKCQCEAEADYTCSRCGRVGDGHVTERGYVCCACHHPTTTHD